MTVVGTATVEIHPDATGFGPKTAAAVKRALAGIQATIELQLDENGLRQKIGAAVAAAGAGKEVEVELEVNSTDFADKVKSAARVIDDIAVELDLDDRGFEEKVARATATLQDIEVGMDVDDTGVRSKVAAAVKKAEAGQEIEIPIKAGGGGGGGPDSVGAAAGGIFGRAVLRSAVRVLAAGGLAQIFTAAAAGAVAIGSGLISATSAAGSLVATAAALPGLFSAAAQAAASISFALGGVGGALKAFGAMQKAVGKQAVGGGGGGGGDNGASARAAERAIRNANRGIEDAERSLADAVEAANERIADSNKNLERAQRDLQDAYEESSRRIADAQRGIADAQDALADAQEGVARAQEEGAERIADAERDLARSHRNVREAQEDLTRAREKAREEIDDLRRSVARLALTEDEARRRLSEAQTKAALARKRESADLTGVTEDTLRALERQAAMEDRAAENPREKAANDLRDAELDLQEATAKRVETETKLATVEKAGVDSTEQVINARERLADAEEGLAQNQRDLGEAQRDAARSVLEANERVADSYQTLTDAQRDLVDAQKESARQISDANEQVAEAQADQAKAYRELVRAQEDGARRIAEAHEALADAIASAAESAGAAAGGAAGAIDAYEAALARLSPAARRFVEFLVSLEPLLRRVQATAAEGLFPGLEQAIRTLLPVVSDLEPIIGDTAFAIAGLAIAGADLIASPAFRGDLITIGRRNIDLIKTFGDAAISFGNSLRHITVAAGPMTQHLADLTLRFSLLAEEAITLGRANGSLEAFFGRVSDRLDKLIISVVGFGTGLFRVFREAMPAGDRYLDTLTRLAVQFDIITDRASKSGAMREFFDSTRPAVEAVARLLADVATGLFNIGTANLGNFTAFVDQLRNELLPVLLEVLGAIDTDFLSALVSLTTGIAHLFGALLVGNPTLTFFVNVLGDLASAISTLLTDIPILSPILQGLVTAFGALAVIGAVTALKQFASSVFGVEKALMTITGSADKAALSATRVGSAFDKAGAIIGRAFLIAGIVLAAKAAVDALAPSIDKVVASVVRAKDPLAEFEKGLQRLNNPGLFDKIGLSLKNAFDNPIKTILSGLPGIGIAMDKLGLNAVKFGTTSNEAFEKVARSSAATAARIIEDAKAQGRNTQDYERILESLIQEKARQGIAEDEVSKRVDAATRSLKGNNDTLQIHIDKMRTATSTALTLSGAETNTEEAIDRLTQALAENGRTYDSNTEAGRANRRQIDELIGSIGREIQELGSSNNATGLSIERKRELLGHLDTLARSGYPNAEATAHRLREELERIQNTYTANVDVDTTRAQQKIASLQRQLNSISAQTVEGEEAGARTSAGVQREFGGRVNRNQVYIVGERRPELFIPDQNGVILPRVPDVAIPKSLERSVTADLNLMPSGTSFDMDGLVRSLEALEQSLTEQLAQAQDRVDAARTTADTAQRDAGAGHSEVNITSPLVTIDATFGPGSTVADLMTAMQGLADDRIAQVLLQILKDHGAGVGTH